MLFFLSRPYFYFKILFKCLLCNPNAGSPACPNQSQIDETGAGAKGAMIWENCGPISKTIPASAQAYGSYRVREEWAFFLVNYLASFHLRSCALIFLAFGVLGVKTSL